MTPPQGRRAEDYFRNVGVIYDNKNNRATLCQGARERNNRITSLNPGLSIQRECRKFCLLCGDLLIFSAEHSTGSIGSFTMRTGVDHLSGPGETTIQLLHIIYRSHLKKVFSPDPPEADKSSRGLPASGGRINPPEADKSRR